MTLYLRSGMIAASLYFALIAVAMTLPSHAQTAPNPTPSPVASETPSAPSDPCGSILSTVNRPTVTTTVCNVRAGHSMLETGYMNSVTTGTGGGATATYAQPFIRVGLSNHLEFAMTPPSYNRSSVGGALTSGYSDMNYGLKWELGYNERAVWSINAQVSGPSGGSGFTAGAAQYTGNVNMGYAFNPVFSAAGTIGFNSLAAPNANGQTQRYFSLVPSIELTAATSRVSQAFVEYAYFSQAGPGLGSKSLIDFGYQVDFGPHVQLDAEYGFQPSILNGQKLHYVGAGLSFMR